MLHAFSEYFQERPLLDRVEFVQVPQDFEGVYRSASTESEADTFKVESDSGFGFVVMNAFRDSDINRLEVRDYIHSLIARKRYEISSLKRGSVENNRGILLGHSKPYQVRKLPPPTLKRALRLQVTPYSKSFCMWLKELLEQGGLEVEVEEISFQESLSTENITGQADLFIHSEVFELNQNLSFFQLMNSGHSPFRRSIQNDPELRLLLAMYQYTPFHEWTELNLKVEQALIHSSILVPLFYAKRSIPFSADLMNITIKHFGYVDLAKLWMKPTIDEGIQNRS